MAAGYYCQEAPETTAKERAKATQCTSAYSCCMRDPTTTRVGVVGKGMGGGASKGQNVWLHYIHGTHCSAHKALAYRVVGKNKLCFSIPGDGL